MEKESKIKDELNKRETRGEHPATFFTAKEEDPHKLYSYIKRIQFAVEKRKIKIIKLSYKLYFNFRIKARCIRQSGIN